MLAIECNRWGDKKVLIILIIQWCWWVKMWRELYCFQARWKEIARGSQLNITDREIGRFRQFHNLQGIFGHEFCFSTLSGETLLVSKPGICLLLNPEYIKSYIIYNTVMCYHLERFEVTNDPKQLFCCCYVWSAHSSLSDALSSITFFQNSKLFKGVVFNFCWKVAFR